MIEPLFTFWQWIPIKMSRVAHFIILDSEIYTMLHSITRTHTLVYRLDDVHEITIPNFVNALLHSRVCICNVLMCILSGVLWCNAIIHSVLQISCFFDRRYASQPTQFKLPSITCNFISLYRMKDNWSVCEWVCICVFSNPKLTN